MWASFKKLIGTEVSDNLDEKSDRENAVYAQLELPTEIRENPRRDIRPYTADFASPYHADIMDLNEKENKNPLNKEVRRDRRKNFIQKIKT